MMSSNGNIFRVTVPLCGEFTSEAELWCFLWYAPEYRVDNREAGDLIRYRAHYDVTVMLTIAAISEGVKPLSNHYQSAFAFAFKGCVLNNGHQDYVNIDSSNGHKLQRWSRWNLGMDK